jgi:hypothetical protein
MSTRSRAALAALLALAASVVLAGPALAADGTTDPPVMDQSPQVMSAGQAALVFVGIPLLVVGLVWLIVSAPGWTRSGRASDADAWAGDPLVIDASSSADPTPAIAGADSAADDATGGTSARW